MSSKIRQKVPAVRGIHHHPEGATHLKVEPPNIHVGFPVEKLHLVCTDERWGTGGGGAALEAGCSAPRLEMSNQYAKYMQIST